MADLIVYKKLAISGGGADALDGVNGSLLVGGELAFVTVSNVMYMYILDVDSAAAESLPDIVSPDVNPGDKRWILQSVSAMPTATAESDFILSGPSPFAWVKKTLAQVKTILGLVLTQTANAVGFSISGGTTPKTLTVSETMTLNGYASATEELTGVEGVKVSSPSVSREMIINLKPVINVSVNKLDIFTKSGGAVPDATNPIKVMIPDGNGYTQRTRAAAYLSGTSQFIMADAANYWSKGSLNTEIKTAYVYAIWDANGGIVWALGGYSGFTRCPASTTATDDDFFLLEEGSTYTKAITDYCVCVGRIRYQYDTADTPDHTIQATVIDAPQVIWNIKSDYGYQYNLVTNITSAGDIAEVGVIGIIVKQSGKYAAWGLVNGSAGGITVVRDVLRMGSSTYASATIMSQSRDIIEDQLGAPSVHAVKYLNVGDSIHLGAEVSGASGTRTIYSDAQGVGYIGCTHLLFIRVD